ncbi:2910_t:CDS:2, partial [Gigaspora margarita]
SLEQTAFISKTGKPTKVCCQCRNNDLRNYYATKVDKNIPCDQNPIEPKEMKKKLFEYVLQVGNDEHVENENSGIEFLCEISTVSLKSEPHELGKAIAEIVDSADGYYYILYISKNNNKYTYWYNCSQSCNLAKRPRKHEEFNKQRDREYIDRFACNGVLKILLDMEKNVAMVDLQHNLLHKRPDRFNVTDDVKAEIQKNIHRMPADIFRQLEQQNPSLTQKQVHAWWTYFLKKEYARDYNNQLNSTKILVEENEFKMILINDQGIKYLGFITPFFELLKNNHEIAMDATYKMNILGYELYAIIGQYDGAGFALAYLFIEGAKKNNGACTSILTLFFETLFELGLNNIYFILKISAAQKVWPNAKIQICFWHMKKALKKRLMDNTYPKVINYSSYSAHEAFKFIDIKFHPMQPSQMTSMQKKSFCFCPKELRPKIIEIMEQHMHLDSLIPNTSGCYLTAHEIWEQSTKQICEFCVYYDLKLLWIYLWEHWYRKELWILWAHCAYDKICIFRTTMLCESHWKVIKRDFLPKFFRPRLDLLTYIMITRLIPHQQQQYIKYYDKREKPSWRKEFKKEWMSLKKNQLIILILSTLKNGFADVWDF